MKKRWACFAVLVVLIGGGLLQSACSHEQKEPVEVIHIEEEAAGGQLGQVISNQVAVEQEAKSDEVTVEVSNGEDVQVIENEAEVRPVDTMESPVTEVVDMTMTPFEMVHAIDRVGVGYDSEQVILMLKTYGVFEQITAETAISDTESYFMDLSITSLKLKDKAVALIYLNAVHYDIYLLLSCPENVWGLDGMVIQNERFKWPYRLESTDDGDRYWLVVSHEANHGSGVSLVDEIWYNPDGTQAAAYPLNGYMNLFLDNFHQDAYATYEVIPSFDGDSQVYLSYTIDFTFQYALGTESNTYSNVLESVYSPVTREEWLCDLSEGQVTYAGDIQGISHKTSQEWGILDGYMTYYRNKLGENTIETLEDWERIILLEDVSE